MIRTLARAAAVLLVLGLFGCGPRWVVDDREYDLHDVEAGVAEQWRAAEPVEAGEACAYWTEKQSEAGRVHTRMARKVGDFRRLRLWTQAKRLSRCRDAGEVSGNPMVVSDPQAEDAPPPPATEAAEDAPPPPSTPTEPQDEDAPPPLR